MQPRDLTSLWWLPYMPPNNYVIRVTLSECSHSLVEVSSVLVATAGHSSLSPLHLIHWPVSTGTEMLEISFGEKMVIIVLIFSCEEKTAVFLCHLQEHDGVQWGGAHRSCGVLSSAVDMVTIRGRGTFRRSDIDQIICEKCPALVHQPLYPLPPIFVAYRVDDQYPMVPRGGRYNIVLSWQHDIANHFLHVTYSSAWDQQILFQGWVRVYAIWTVQPAV